MPSQIQQNFINAFIANRKTNIEVLEAIVHIAGPMASFEELARIFSCPTAIEKNRIIRHAISNSRVYEEDYEEDPSEIFWNGYSLEDMENPSW